MSDIVISGKNISKRYRIGQSKPNSFRESITKTLSFGKKKSSVSEFYALNDVSFEIQRGESLGIIGQNGAGKSTLLKILSRITEPTAGRIEIDGRVASLLEVGTGFHAELSGRENIYLNGTILGMSRNEIKSKFDEIVDFSGVEKFIDTPVKHYSSGMYVRLAFSVAAHLEPEILIVDEVLAVGDASFQKRCLGKMDAVTKAGRTVIFVSHDMGAISSLCSRALLLEEGCVKKEGDVKGIIDSYLHYSDESSLAFKDYSKTEPEEQNGNVKLNHIKLIDREGRGIKTFNVNQSAGIEINFDIIKEGINPVPNVHLFNAQAGKLLISVDSCDNELTKKGRYQSTMWFPENFLNNGMFHAGVAISTLDPVEVHVADYSAIVFEVLDDLSSITRNGYAGKMDGYIRPIFKWDNKVIE